MAADRPAGEVDQTYRGAVGRTYRVRKDVRTYRVVEVGRTYGVGEDDQTRRLGEDDQTYQAVEVGQKCKYEKLTRDESHRRR